MQRNRFADTNVFIYECQQNTKGQYLFQDSYMRYSGCETNSCYVFDSLWLKVTHFTSLEIWNSASWYGNPYTTEHWALGEPQQCNNAGMLLEWLLSWQVFHYGRWLGGPAIWYTSLLPLNCLQGKTRATKGSLTSVTNSGLWIGLGAKKNTLP